MNKILAKEAIKSFLIEDIGTGVFDNELRASGNFVAKDDGVVCGTEIIDMVYSFFSDDYNITLLKKDGESVKKGEIIATVEARVATMLSGERVALNLMQLMCGIATTTRKYVDTLNDNNIRVCDTRKTHPGLRVFEKYAVTCGGGFNHRFALYDGVMLKDNHIAFAGGITKAVQLVKSKLGHMVKVEVETETKEQVIEAEKADNARNYSQCDSLLLGDKCGAHTFPYMDIHNETAVVEHEATTSKISEDQIFYCNQRGIPTEDAIGLIVNGYAKEVLNKLPMEFAVEAQKLLTISLEGSVG